MRVPLSSVFSRMTAVGWSGAGEDFVEGLAQGAHLDQVLGAELADAAHLPAFHELRQLLQGDQSVLASRGGGGVDKIDHGGERVHHVMSKWHVASS